MQTVNDLIQKLRSYPPNLLVLTPGFDEGGISLVETSLVELYLHKANYPYQSDRMDCAEVGSVSSDEVISIAVLLTFGEEFVWPTYNQIQEDANVQ